MKYFLSIVVAILLVGAGCFPTAKPKETVQKEAYQPTDADCKRITGFHNEALEKGVVRLGEESFYRSLMLVDLACKNTSTSTMREFCEQCTDIIRYEE